MPDGDPDILPEAAPRPSRPVLAPKPAAIGRPVLPGSSGLRAQVEPDPEIIDEPVVEPPPPAPPPRPPVFVPKWARPAVQQTLLPPMVVLTAGFTVLGFVYFRQPDDAALRTLPAIFAWASLAVAVTAAVGTMALWVSIRRR
ncbi:MAG: hypothetical protein QM754_12615 [Tepidisphaeraceae bacterium]